MKTSIKIIALFICTGLFSQTENSASKLLNEKNEKFTFGGYGEVHYNQGVLNDTRQNGKLDVHRLVLLFGYHFNNKLSFVSEIEYEHVKEVYIEQAFLNYRFSQGFNLRGGLMLIPMGIINEYHEPTTFNSVERPYLDNKIVPSTWREIGIGASGNIPSASLSYQAYIVNGFLGYDNGDSKLSGKNGFRKGRQKGAESIISSPNFSTKLNYYGIKGLNIGASLYTGKTQSTEFNNLDTDNPSAENFADSTRVGLTMLGLDARYKVGKLALSGQINYVSISNTEEFNHVTSSDLGSEMLGYYIEGAYNVLPNNKKTKLSPFFRYEKVNTHKDTEGSLEINKSLDKTILTSGLHWKIDRGVSIKADYQMIQDKAKKEWDNTINLGIGFWIK